MPTAATWQPQAVSPTQQPQEHRLPAPAASSQTSAAVLTTLEKSWLFEPYQHQEDYVQLCEICKDVYGGTDYMPRMLPEYAGQPSKLLIVAVQADHAQTRRVDGIIGAELRGDMIFVFGLRVRAASRSNGLGRKLMAEVCARAQARFGAAAVSLASVTSADNQAAQRIIGSQMAAPWLWMDLWPAYSCPALRAYEASVGWPAQPAPRERAMLDSFPGARDALLSDATAVQLLEQWTPATSMQQVSRTLCAIREQHLQQHHQRRHQQQGGGSVLQTPGGDWLPFFYDLFPAGSEWGMQQLQEGRIWVLGEPTCQQQQQQRQQDQQQQDQQQDQEQQQDQQQQCQRGVMVLAKSLEGRRWTAGIVASDTSVLNSALLLADRQQPHWVAFIDRGCYLAQGPGECVVGPMPAEPARPPVYYTTHGAHAGNMIVFGRGL